MVIIEISEKAFNELRNSIGGLLNPHSHSKTSWHLFGTNTVFEILKGN